MKLEIGLSEAQIKHVKAFLNCCKNIGPVLLLKAGRTNVELLVLNCAKSAFLSILLNAAFFNAYSLSVEEVESSNSLQAGVLLKHVLASFRIPRIKQMEIHIADDDSMWISLTSESGAVSIFLEACQCTMLSPILLSVSVQGPQRGLSFGALHAPLDEQVTVKYISGMQKRYHLGCVSEEHVTVNIRKDMYPTEIVADAQQLQRVLQSFQASHEEITLVARPEQCVQASSQMVQMVSYVSPAKAKLQAKKGGGVLRTRIQMDTRGRELFRRYAHKSGHIADVTFNLRDFGTIVQLCRHTAADVLLSVGSAGDPLVAETCWRESEINGRSSPMGCLAPHVHAELVLATISESVAGELPELTPMPTAGPLMVSPLTADRIGGPNEHRRESTSAPRLSNGGGLQDPQTFPSAAVLPGAAIEVETAAVSEAALTPLPALQLPARHDVSQPTAGLGCITACTDQATPPNLDAPQHTLPGHDATISAPSSRSQLVPGNSTDLMEQSKCGKHNSEPVAASGEPIVAAYSYAMDLEHQAHASSWQNGKGNVGMETSSDGNSFMLPSAAATYEAGTGHKPSAHANFGILHAGVVARKSAFSQHLVRLAQQLEREQLVVAATGSRAQVSSSYGCGSKGVYERVSMRPDPEAMEPVQMGAEGEFAADDEECMATPPDARPPHEAGLLPDIFP